MNLTRKQAADLIDQFRCIVASVGDIAENSPLWPMFHALADAGLAQPKPCTGEAHANANIDHCAVCLPLQWGFTGERTIIR